MEEANKDDFGSMYEAISRRAHLSAYVLVAGLVLELINAIIWYKGTETLAEMAAVLLIVGGVWGEIFFGHKARVAGDKQIVQYEARAREAQLETQRLKAQFAGRQVLPEQHEKIVDAIRDKAALLDVIIEYERGDAEAFSYLGEIANVFADAGVAEIRYDANSFLGPGFFGLYAAAAPEIDATTIINAFAEAGMPLTIQNMDLSKHLPRNLRAPNLYIFVAPKLPLPMVAMRVI